MDKNDAVVLLVICVLSAIVVTSAVNDDQASSLGSGQGAEPGQAANQPSYDSSRRRYPAGYGQGSARYGSVARRRLGAARNRTALRRPVGYGRDGQLARKLPPSARHGGPEPPKDPGYAATGRQGYRQRPAYAGPTYGQTQRTSRSDASRGLNGQGQGQNPGYDPPRQRSEGQSPAYPGGNGPQRGANNRRMPNGRRLPGQRQRLLQSGAVQGDLQRNSPNTPRRQPVRGQNRRVGPERGSAQQRYDMPPGMKIPDGFKIPEGMRIPEGYAMPEGMTLPEGFKIPEGVQIPEGFQIPERLENVEASPTDSEMKSSNTGRTDEGQGQLKPQNEKPPTENIISGSDTTKRQQIPPKGNLPKGLKLPADFKIPEDFELPPGFEIPEGLEIPEGFEVPDGFKLPEGLKIPEGFEIPPSMKGVLAGMGKQGAGLDTQGDMLANLPNNSVIAMVGLPVLLRCSFPPDRPGSVVWVGPNGVDIVAYDHDVVLDALADRIRVAGSRRLGSYDLLLKYAEFPADNGTWTCKQIGGDERHLTLVVVVPPLSRTPDVTPSDAADADARRPWTFSCVGQFAHPPVSLTWIKVSGPGADFIRTPPQYATSPTQGVASTVNLVVSPQNSGSTFSCQARHPTFQGKVYSVNVTYGGPQFAALVQENERPSLSLSAVAMDANDVAMLIVVAVVVVVAFIISVSLYKGRAGWELDVRPRVDYVRVPTTDVEAPTDNAHSDNVDNGTDSTTANGTPTQAAEVEVISNGNLKGNAIKSRAAIPSSLQRKCVAKAVFGAIFSVLLLLSLGLSIPLYLKGITPPTLGTDTMTSVVAGSALWLDCSALATPPDSVLDVTWYKDATKFYHQTHVTGSNVGYPSNSTGGLAMGMRVTSNWFGQVNIWPIMPGEQGVYSCQVTSAVNHHGETVVKTRSFGVFVITGIFVNKALLAILGIALCSAVCLIIIALYHSIRCTRSKCAGGT